MINFDQPPKNNGTLAKSLAKAEEKTDRIWLAFESGDQEVFAFDGKTETLSMVESEKQKEHEAPLTGLDFNR